MLANFRLLEIIRMRWEIDERAGEHIFDDFFEPRISHTRHHAISQTVIEIRQYVTGRPRSSCAGHRISQAPEQITPSQHLSHLRLHATKIFCACSVHGLQQQAGNEIEFHRQAHATVKHESRKETRTWKEIIHLFDVAVGEHIFPWYENLIEHEDRIILIEPAR